MIWQAVRDAVGLLLAGDAALWHIIAVSLATTFCALILAAPLAIVIGYAIASFRFPGRRLAIWLVQAALSIPTVLVGLLLYLLLSRQGPWGGLGWLFTQPGLVLGQVVIALPVLIAFTLAAVQGADVRYAETAIAHGATRWRTMLVVLHEVRFGVMAAVISGFGRVISEVGCALMVGGNIAGETRTMTTAIALETSKGEFAQGIALGIVLIMVALLMNGALMLLQGDAHSAGRRA